MKAVIGGTGQVGRHVVRALVAQGETVACISRQPCQDATDQVAWRHIESYSSEDVRSALSGCSGAIATLGLPYDADVWLREWAPLVKDVAQGCLTAEVPLTFLDNLYPVGRAAMPITEQSPVAPCSKKGQARAEGLSALAAARQDGLDVVVCRSSDFVGPGLAVTILPWKSIERVLTHHSAKLSWIGDPSTHHSFSWVPEIASCLAQVCEDPNLRRHGLVNLPVLAPLSGRELAHILSDITGESVKVSAMRDPMLKIASPFMRSAREQLEMMYEVDQDFLVSDDLIRSMGWACDRLCIEECVRNSMRNR